MALNPRLRSAVDRTRQELVAGREWLIADGDQPRTVLALNRHGVRILQSALDGEVDAQEILDWLAACAEQVESGPDPSRYAETRARWWAVFRELAEGAGARPPWSAERARLVDLTAAAQILGVSKSFVEKRVKEGALPSVKLGRSRRFDISDLETYIRQQRGWH